MYDYLDRPVGTLDEGSRFLVWSMRAWTQCMAERRCPPSVLAPGFARADLDAMLPHFHMAMMTLNRDGLDKMGFGQMACPEVSEAEAILLAVVAHYAAHRVKTGHATAALLVGEQAVVILRRALMTVGILTYARFPFDPAPTRPESRPANRNERPAESPPTNGIKNGIHRGVDGE